MSFFSFVRRSYPPIAGKAKITKDEFRQAVIAVATAKKNGDQGVIQAWQQFKASNKVKRNKNKLSKNDIMGLSAQQQTMYKEYVRRAGGLKAHFSKELRKLKQHYITLGLPLVQKPQKILTAEQKARAKELRKQRGKKK